MPSLIFQWVLRHGRLAAVSVFSSFLTLIVLVVPVHAKDISGSGDAEIAAELTNPIADITIIPIQMNYDRGIGEDDGWKLQTNVQPVIPVNLNEDWNLITRPVIPVIYQEDALPGEGSQFGLGDTLLNLFFSPVKPTDGGIIWGAGPVLLLPTATDSKLGGKKWGAGPSAIALIRPGAWTVGALGSHVWSFAGDDDRRDVSLSSLQPFVAYTWPNAWGASVNSESTYDWETEQWAVPITATVSKLVRLGKMPVRFQGGIGYWVESPDEGPEGVRFTFQTNFVLPN